ncbi:hypothetical protein CBL_20080 [Carabus blaptoides fortunei]
MELNVSEMETDMAYVSAPKRKGLDPETLSTIDQPSASNTDQGGDKSCRLHPVTLGDRHDLREVRKQFKEKEISFHTYQLSEDQLLKIVIRGIPEDISPDEIKLALKELKYPVESVTRIKSGPSHKPLPMVLVQLKKPEGKGIFNLTNILYLRVRVESLGRLQATPPKLERGSFADVAKNKSAHTKPGSNSTKPNSVPNTTAKNGNSADTLITLFNIITELNSAKSSAEQIPILLKALTKLQQ